MSTIKKTSFKLSSGTQLAIKYPPTKPIRMANAKRLNSED